MFTLDQLRGFVAVAEELHFGRAAERLRMTQPPLTRQIQGLERAVGVRLLDRNNRRVALTPAGDVFLAEAQRLLALAAGAPDLARRVAAGSVGTVRVGFMPSATWEVLPALLRRVEQALPDLDLDLVELGPQEQVAGLRSGELDLGLARPRALGDGVSARVVKREDLALVVPEGHRLLGLGRPIEAVDLAREPLILYSPTKAGYFHSLVVGLVPVDPEAVVHGVGQVLTAVWLAAAGRGLAFAPASTSRLGVPGVRYLELAAAPAGIVETNLMWPTQARNPALTRVLAAIGQGELNARESGLG